MDEKTKNNCTICGEIIGAEDKKVSCKDCGSCYHQSCTKINDNMDAWTCPKCNTGVLKVPDAPKSNRSRSHCSHRSKKSHSSSSSRVELLLRSVDEEKKMLDEQQLERQKLLEEKLQREHVEREKLLEEKHRLERNLLLKKQQILKDSTLQHESSSKGSVILPVPSMSSKDKVAGWVKANANHQTLNDAQQVEQPLMDRVHDDTHIQIQPITQSTIVKPGDVFLPNNQNPLTQSNSQSREEKSPSNVDHHHPSTRPVANEPQRDNITHYVSQIRPTSHSLSVSRILTKEQIAARHVLKELPTFDGKPRSWPKFISSFQRSTDLCGFSDSENLERLARALQGSAYMAVETSLTLEDNVPRILEILEILFGKPEYIISSLVDDMRKGKRPTIENVESILCYALEIENISCTMRLAKLSEHLWNPVLLTEMLDRLPSQMKMEWAEYTYKRTPCNIEVFSAWLKEKSMKLSTLLTKPPILTRASKNYDKNKSNFVNVHEEAVNITKCCVCGSSCKNVEVCAAFKEMSYKRKWVEIKNNFLCRTCLRRHRGQCKKLQICGKDGCEFFHHELLHKPESASEDAQNEISGNLNTHMNSKTDCIFKVLPVTIHNGGKFVNTYAMLDDCSSLTLISQEVAEKIGASGPKQSLCLQWTSNVKRIEDNSQKLTLQISGKSDGKLHQLKCRTVNNLSLPQQSLQYQELCLRYPHLNNLPISSYRNAEVGVLIGINNPTLLLTHNYKFNQEDEPFAAFTKLGCVVFGSNISNDAGIFHVRECECFQDDTTLDKLLRENYAIESLGLQKSVDILPTEDKRAYDIWEKATKFLGDRYETGLLFKYDKFQLPNSYNMATRRLQCLLKKCEKEPGLRHIISSKIEEYEKKGYARKVSQQELETLNRDLWYLPIFVVRNPNKPSKVRLVWDAAATVGGTSLNSVLVKGPDLLSSLISVLLRFRQFKVAMSADIQEMFHQIRIKRDDQRYQMFMWPNDIGEVETYAMVGMTFGASCSPSTAQHIKNLNAEAFRNQFPRAVEAIVDNHYVDDLLESLENEEQAIQLAQDVIKIHQKAGFNIRNWVSNSAMISDAFQDTPSETRKTLDFPQEPAAEKILGMWWETNTDNFTYSLRYHKMDEDIWKGKRSPTKREVLRAVMSIYDPLGLLSHVLIFPKIILQNIWRTESSWDEAISPDLTDDWRKWLEILPRVERLKIPRWYGYSSKVEAVDLHVFTDASKEAYAATVYIRFYDVDNNRIMVRLVAAKSRVAPLKYVSIPRLELMGAVIGARLAETVKTSLKIPIRKITFWTDSTCVLAWIQSDHRKYRPYVAARIGEILETTSSSDWRYVPTNKNVADEATRMKVIHPTSECAWYNGPEFLYAEEFEWPQKKLTEIETEEMMLQYVVSVNIHHAEVLVDKFSSWSKLCRVQAYVLRFIDNLKSRVKGNLCSAGHLSSDELRRAENTLYRQAQEESYSEEIACLESGTCHIPKNSPVFKDNPYIDDCKVMRARSRIDAVNNIPFSVKRPILLPKVHKITDLIMNHYHNLYHHGNSETVINELRQKFIIPTMRVKLRTIKNRCQWCKNKSAKPQQVIMGDLPSVRLATFTRAFSCIGVDYFGPLYVAVRRCREKRWGILITCLTTRGVHIELAHSLSSDSCILGLRRFMSRRGTPREIYSDNATNFKGASKELKAAMENVNSKLVAQHFTTADTNWSFIPPASPHMGGAWERMVRSVKSVLYSTFPLKTTPTDETLMTILLEAENIINSRPLTYVPLDSDTDEALTPNHFILGSSNGLKSLGDFEGEGSVLKSHWKQSQLYADVIWRKWIQEILPDLRRRTKWQTDGRPIKLDDIVLVIEDNTPRNCYKKAKVIGLNTGHDGKVRSVSIQTEGGIYVRPVSKLAVLDVYSEAIDESVPMEHEGTLGGSVEKATSPLHTHQSKRHLRPLPHRE